MPRDFTTSGIPLKPVYDALPGDARALGEPGEFPYGRGIYENMYRGRLWTMRQYAGFATAAESNARYRYLLERGQTGLSVAFDLPTQLGYDSDAPQARGEVGKVGVAIDSIADMETLFDGIPLDRVTVSMTINAPAAILLALLLARRTPPRHSVCKTRRHRSKRRPQRVCRARNVHLSAAALDAPRYRRDGVLRARSSAMERDFDLRLPYPRSRLDRRRRDRLHAFQRQSVSARRARRRDSTLDSIAPRISFFWNAHNDFFEEVAKFRAARYLWAHITRDEFGCTDPRSQMLRFHTQTGGSTLTAQEPDNNVVRVTLQALAAVLGRHAVAAHQRQRRSPRAADRRERQSSRCGRSRSSRTNRESPTSSTRWRDRITSNR